MLKKKQAKGTLVFKNMKEIRKDIGTVSVISSASETDFQKSWTFPL